MIIITSNGYIRKGAFSRDKGTNKDRTQLITESYFNPPTKITSATIIKTEPPPDPTKICPSCKIRQRKYDHNGEFYRSYCSPCHRKCSIASYHRRKGIETEKRNTTLCSRCGKNQKEEPSSRHNSYCTECRRLNKRESYQRKKNKKQLSSINSLTLK